MSHQPQLRPRQNNKMVSDQDHHHHHHHHQFGDTTYSKIFVGGLAWETQRDTLKRYFDQFGEILEAVVITDRITGKSKGYGFVTFKDPESAKRACQNPSPVIDGRRANCNLAYLGANKNRPTFSQHGMEKISPAVTSMAHLPVHDSSKYFRQPVPQYPLSYSIYGYPAYSHLINAMNYYNAYYGGQQQLLSSYYTTRFPGTYLNYYPSYAQQEPNNPNQQPKMVQFSYFPQQYRASGISNPPVSASPSLTLTAGPATEMATGGTKLPGAASEQNSSA